MNATLALLTYAVVALALVGGGIYALNRGFRLILSGKGKSKEESSVEVLGLKATVGSLGALVMVTAFLWGFAAVFALPKYKDPNVTVRKKDETISNITTQLVATKMQLAAGQEAVAAARDLGGALAAQQSELAKWQAAVKANRLEEASVHAEKLQAEIPKIQKQLDEMLKALQPAVETPVESGKAQGTAAEL